MFFLVFASLLDSSLLGNLVNLDTVAPLARLFKVVVVVAAVIMSNIGSLLMYSGGWRSLWVAILVCIYVRGYMLRSVFLCNDFD